MLSSSIFSFEGTSSTKEKHDKAPCEWPVSMTVRFHLFPFRTQKLSSLVPKIVGWKRPVKIGRCRLLFKPCSDLSRAFCLCRVPETEKDGRGRRRAGHVRPLQGFFGKPVTAASGYGSRREETIRLQERPALLFYLHC